MDEVMNGKGDYFPGLIQLCYAYLEHIACDATSFARIHQYLSLVRKRACGELLTPAAWIRQFVLEHPEYKKDSVIAPGMAVDLMTACDEIGRGVRPCPELHGDVVIDPVIKEGLYLTKLSSEPSAAARCTLLRKLRARACTEDGPFSSPSAPIGRRVSDPKLLSRQVSPASDQQVEMKTDVPL